MSSESEDKKQSRPNPFLSAGRVQRQFTRMSEDVEKRMAAAGAKPWYRFRENIADYFPPLNEGGQGLKEHFPSIEADVRKAVEAAHARGRKAFMLDIAGEADGASLGAEKTFCLALTNSRGDTNTRTTVAGDMFQKHVRRLYFKTVDSEEGDIVFASFLPIGGAPHHALMEEKGPEYVATHLFELFQETYRRLTSPGLLVMQMTVMDADSVPQFLAYLRNQGIKYEASANTLDIVIKK